MPGIFSQLFGIQVMFKGEWIDYVPPKMYGLGAEAAFHILKGNPACEGVRVICDRVTTERILCETLIYVRDLPKIPRKTRKRKTKTGKV